MARDRHAPAALDGQSIRPKPHRNSGLQESRGARHGARVLARMSQRDVERVLGRLLTDERFRRAFQHDPAGACRAAGFELSGLELEALAAIPSRALPRFVAQIDERIRRLELPVDPSKENP